MRLRKQKKIGMETLHGEATRGIMMEERITALGNKRKVRTMLKNVKKTVCVWDGGVYERQKKNEKEKKK